MIIFEEELSDISQVENAELLIFNINKREVKNQDYSRILKALELLKKAGKSAKGKVLLTFDGYDKDSREIYMIPEIRAYIKHIYEKYKYFFYFLTTMDNNRSVILACLNDFQAIQNDNNGVLLRIIPNDIRNNDITKAMKEYGKEIGEDDMEKVIYTFI